MHGQDANEVVARHIDAGCKPVKPIPIENACSVTKCKETELQKCICQYCNKNFCFQHKHPLDHECEKYTATATTTSTSTSQNKSSFLEALSASQKRLQEAIKKFAESNNPNTRKLAMLKMKQQAVGKSNVPMDKRFYIETIFPLELKMESKMFFFDESQRWGVILDGIAESARIQNENNVAKARKLILVSLKTGEPISLGKPMKETKNLVQTGDAVMLEYEDTIHL